MINKQQILNIGFFNLARIQSLKVNFRARIGAVLVKKGKPINVGQNKPYKTHPFIRKYHKHKTIHAEIDTIIGLDRHLVNGSNLYVYREISNGDLANSKPCEMCMKILKDLGLRRIYYTHEKGYSEIKL